MPYAWLCDKNGDPDAGRRIFFREEDRPRWDRLLAAWVTMTMSGSGGRNNSSATASVRHPSPLLPDERPLQAFYQDVCRHEDYWFENAFTVEKEVADYAVNILGTLSLIRLSGGYCTKCLEILVVNGRILEVYRCLAAEDPDIMANLLKLEYNFNMLSLNANMQIGNREVCLKSYRAAAAYEIEQGFDPDQQLVACLLASRVPEEEDYMNLEFLEETPDDFLWTKIKAAEQTKGFPFCAFSPTARVEPMLCDGCGTWEETGGDFQRCAACKNAYYCSRNCQCLHWKLHKPYCQGKSPESSSLMKNLKALASLWVDINAVSVAQCTGSPVSDENKKAAFPGVVKFFMDYVADHSEYDAPGGLRNLFQSREFMFELDAFLEKRTGFESLAIINHTLEMQERRQLFFSGPQSQALFQSFENIDEAEMNSC